jgi:hypothetical protein
MRIYVPVDSEGENARTFANPRSTLSIVTQYYYRRKLAAKDLLPAIGVGAMAGLAAFYLVQLLIQRTALVSSERLSLPAEPSAPRLRTG